MVRNDGNVVELEETAGFFDGEGNLQRVIGTTLDVTERKRVGERACWPANNPVGVPCLGCRDGTGMWTDVIWYGLHICFICLALTRREAQHLFETWNAILHQEGCSGRWQMRTSTGYYRTTPLTEYRIIRPDNGEIRWINALGRVV